MLNMLVLNSMLNELTSADTRRLLQQAPHPGVATAGKTRQSDGGSPRSVHEMTPAVRQQSEIIVLQNSVSTGKVQPVVSLG